MRAFRCFPLASVAMFICLAGSSAGAQDTRPNGADPIEEARRLFEDEADFERASEVLAAAAHGVTLTRAQVIAWLELTARVGFALERPEVWRAALLRLGALDASYRLPSGSSPTLVAALSDTLAQLHGALAVEAEVDASPGMARITARTIRDPGELVEHVRIRVRTSGGAWRQSEAEAAVPMPAGGALEYVAEAIGPGGAVLATRGTEQAPIRVEVPAMQAAPSAADATPDPRVTTSDDTWIVIGVVSGAVIVVASVLIAVLVATAPQPSTIVQAPTLE